MGRGRDLAPGDRRGDGRRPARYLTDRAIQAQRNIVFSWGTFAVNIAGSLILGLVAGLVTADAADDNVQLLLGTGLCGALTTYSTFSYETLRLAEDRAGRFAAANVVGSVFAGLGAAALGLSLGLAAG